MFLQENSQFPPNEISKFFSKWQEYSIWYSAEPEYLLSFYATQLSNIYNIDGTFWKKIQREQSANAVNLPVAKDVSETSSNLLFSEKPIFTFNKEIDSGQVIEKFNEENSIYSFLLESSEICAALGGAYLKLDMDKRLSNFPILSVRNPLQVIPTFLRGRLWEVLFFREVKRNDDDVVWRLFENRKRNGNDLVIEYRLYKGRPDKVGKIIPLDSIDETKSLQLEDIVIKNVGCLGVVYVPNMRPNRLDVNSYHGDNDFGKAIGMMDSLDLSWNSWIRDIELGMGQIFIAEDLLVKEEQSIFGDNKTMLNKFSKFEKCFINLNLSEYNLSGGNVKPIECSQFEMRVEEHQKSCHFFHSQILTMCGYSPSTFGIDVDGNVESGRALKIRERKSYLTREKKANYWQAALKELFNQIQILTSVIQTIEKQDIQVEIEDSIIIDQFENSNTLKNLDQARAISTYLKVKMQHKDWNEKEIEEEVKRILDEENITKTNIFDDEPIDLNKVKNGKEEEKNKNMEDK